MIKKISSFLHTVRGKGRRDSKRTGRPGSLLRDARGTIAIYVAISAPVLLGIGAISLDPAPAIAAASCPCNYEGALDPRRLRRFDEGATPTCSELAAEGLRLFGRKAKPSDNTGTYIDMRSGLFALPRTCQMRFVRGGRVIIDFAHALLSEAEETDCRAKIDAYRAAVPNPEYAALMCPPPPSGDVDVTVDAAPPPPPPSGDVDVTVQPGENIQAAIDGSAEGDVILLMPGTYIGQTFMPKNNQVILADGVVMDGQGTIVRAIPRGTITGVRIEGLTVTNYNSPAQANGGAIDGRGHTNWTLVDVNVIANRGEGIHLGAGWHLIGGLYADNGTIAIGGGGGGSIVIEDIECRNNNTTHQGLGFESGCMKIWGAQAHITGICSWGNWGPGIWLDSTGVDAPSGHVIEDNIIFDNKKGGIEIELQNGGVVRGNKVYRNGFDNTWGGGAGIIIQNSGGFLVHDNFVEIGVNMFGDIGNSIFTINQDRAVMARDNDIFNNEIVFLADGKGTQGTVQDFDSGFDPFAANTWRNNVIVRTSEAPVRYGGWYAWAGGWRDWAFVQANGGEVGSQLILEQRQPTQVQCPLR